LLVNVLLNLADLIWNYVFRIKKTKPKFLRFSTNKS